MFDCVLIHYGEIGLKGLNRPQFEKKLIENIKKAIKGCSYKAIRKIHRIIIIELDKKSDVEKIKEALKCVFGIAWFALCFKTKANIEEIKRIILEKIKIESGIKIKITTNRADKSLPFTSNDVNKAIGHFLVKNFNVAVDLKSPKLEIFIELVDGKAYVFLEKIKGLYGLPVGTSGKVLHLLSGGIDSPVAAWLLMKRGCEVDFLHFHGFKSYDEKLNEKILSLVKILAKYCYSTKIFFVPFYPFQVEALKAPIKYGLILFRRFMVRVAEELAKKYGIKAFGSGESLAQVSSQTLENISAINAAASLPIFRPLLTFDKNEIIQLAKKIRTYAISILPYKDCCSSFISKHPILKADLEKVEEIEKNLDLKKAVSECVKNCKIVEIEL